LADDSDSTEEKTEQPTQQRREEFRKSGQVAQSREVASILVLLGVAVVLYFLSREFLNQLENLFKMSFTENIIAAAKRGDLIPALKMAFNKAFIIVAPVFGIAMFMGIGATVVQVGFISAWDHISPNLERINPVSGFSRLFNMRNLVEGIKSIVKIILIGTAAFLIIKNEMIMAPKLVQFSTSQTMAHLGHVLFKLIGGISALLTLLAILDYGFQRWDLEKRMRMSKQEVKEEFKQREGDPLIKSRIKRIQRELAQKRMMEKVPKADVIITNPTHIAVAIQYDRGSMAAPTLVAKGADLIAERIKKIAREHNIPVVENKPCATKSSAFPCMRTFSKCMYMAPATATAERPNTTGNAPRVTLT
jgi:flagellar biosynthetic protein FlhB